MTCRPRSLQVLGSQLSQITCRQQHPNPKYLESKKYICLLPPHHTHLTNPLSHIRFSVLVCLGYYNKKKKKKKHRRGRLQTIKIDFLQFWRLDSKIKAPAWSSSVASHLPGTYVSSHSRRRGRISVGLFCNSTNPTHEGSPLTT